AQDAVQEELRFKGKIKAQSADMSANMFLPKAAVGQLPAMVIVHASGGPRQVDLEYARQLTAMGVASVLANHYAPRGVTRTVDDQLSVRTEDMLGDAFAMLDALTRDPRIDSARIGIMGFSKGGSVALDSSIAKVAERFLPGGPRFALHVPFYPGCLALYREPRTTGAPIVLLIAEKDNWVGSAKCIGYANDLKAAGAKLRLIVYQGAGHGWDQDRNAHVANAQFMGRCGWQEQADGGWIEMFTGLRTSGPGAVPIPGAMAEVMAKCPTRGASVEVDSRVKDAAMAELRTAVQSSFGVK
ncbi:MAG: dienelactone hydrolase family protein, partial [Terriglobales bacterium]